MHLFRILLLNLMIVCSVPAVSSALDLLGAYQKAKMHDPEYRSAYYDYKATLTFKDQSVSKVLPEISASYSVSRYRFTEAGWQYIDYTSKALVFSVRQNIFDLPSFIEIKQSVQRGDAGGLQFKNAEQNLIKKVSDAYVDLLYAEEALNVVKEEKKAIEAQLNMAKKLFKAGEASLTDIHDAEAKYYNVEYRVVDAEKISIQREKLLQ